MSEINPKLKSKVFAIFLAVTFVFLMPSSTLAAEGVSWQVENFGVFQTPAKWQTVRLEEVLDRLENILFKQRQYAKPKEGDQTAIDPEKLQTDFINAKNQFDKVLKEQNINIYQVVLDDNNAYYVAGLALFKEDKPMAENEAAYFDEKTTKKTRQDFAAIMMAVQNETINSAQMWSDVKPNFDMDFKILPAGPVEQLTVKNAPAYGIGNRIIVNAFGVTAPYYLKTYIFNLNGHRAYAVVWSLDSERAFWDKAFRPVISSLN